MSYRIMLSWWIVWWRGACYLSKNSWKIKRIVESYSISHLTDRRMLWLIRKEQLCFLNSQCHEIFLGRYSVFSFEQGIQITSWDIVHFCEFFNRIMQKAQETYGMLIIGLPSGHFAEKHIKSLRSISFDTLIYSISFPRRGEGKNIKQLNNASFECALL